MLLTNSKLPEAPQNDNPRSSDSQLFSLLKAAFILLAGMDNGRELRALDYSLEEVDHIFKTFLSQDFIPQ
jgi:hypothetical protein